MKSDNSGNNLNSDADKTKVLGSKDMESTLREMSARSKRTPKTGDYSEALLEALNDTENSDSVFKNFVRANVPDDPFAEEKNEKAIAAKVNSLMDGGELPEDFDESDADIDATSELAENFESSMYRPGSGSADYSGSRLRRETRYERQKRTRKNRKILIISIVSAVVLIALIVIIAISCSRKSAPEEETPTETESETEEILDDEISVNIEDGGEYEIPLRIEVTSSQSNKIYYTTDGSEATTSSEIYSGGIDLSEEGTYTINIATYTTSSKKKGEFSATITLVYAGVADPVISPDSGTYSSYQDITVSAGEGVKIYYTYDGSTPDEYSDVYYEPVEMLRGTYIFSAAAVNSEGIWSGVVTRSYTLEIPSAYTEEQAVALVMKELLYSGKIIDENGATDSGGKASVSFTENHTIGNVVYMVCTVKYTDKDEKEEKTEYYGVNDQTGDIMSMTKIDGVYGLN